MDLGLKGKVAIVTAASRGLGRAVAAELASEGAQIAICSRNADTIESVAGEIARETGRKVLFQPCDVTDSASVSTFVRYVEREAGGVDILVANAGGPPRGTFEDFDDDAWRSAFELTFLSVVRLVREVVPSMRRRGGGRIVTISSSSVKQPIPNLLLSNALRPGVLGLVKTLSQELAQDGILVNSLSPGRINTERLQENDLALASKAGRSVDDVRARSHANIPLHRYGNVDEISAAIAFMVSARASYMTGTSVVVDGGMIKALH